MRALVTTTGLSPEFHLASFNTGRAGSFRLPPLAFARELSQSEKSHRSRSRPSPTFGLTTATSTSTSGDGGGDDDDDEDGASMELAASGRRSSAEESSLSPSRYSFISPRLLLMANFVLDTGTTELAHTSPATTHNATTEPIPASAVASGRTGSNT
eukprot:CAMPEP_0113556490 /NCGR_PEP_ID=MMETSP0015_2-20120614/17282_1 /TAXON_ID=2838 /ORGANISM="Odontella" /LENGTH=155 /DNA_ID=CAMNT_0000457845 /DNA_START=44 /DNA_END=508 /DNA_ORIENTATION=+ /assembly_acc=CAM_ASM_000160